MAQSYQEFIDWLYGLQRFGIKLGLEKISYLLNEIGNPHTRYPVIHVAGSNGKGSVASMIAAVLQAHGLRVGLYTSPHLVRFSERIKINGEEIAESDVVNYSNHLQNQVDTLRATFFEATTAMAMKYFADRKVEVAVLETGLGGRFDATNVVTPVLSVITSVGLEHQKYLGRTIGRIAYEKGGIIKAGVPVVSGVQSARAIEVLNEIAGYMNAPIVEVTPHTTAILQEKNLHRSVADIYFRDVNLYESFVIGLPGVYQIQNALTAIRAIDVLRGKVLKSFIKWEITDEQLRYGFERIIPLTDLKGRMQLLQRNGSWLLDVAHNPGGMRELVRSITEAGMVNLPVVFGVVNDKDVRSMLRSLSRVAKVLYLVEPMNERAVSVQELHDIAQEMFFPVIECGPVERGIRQASEQSENTEIVLVCGSHFVIGEALKFLESNQ
jgi:dihydrofolate synthase / folylpolyglutamate synthase